MSKLYIIYKNRTTAIELPEPPPYLKRYINMDTGKISFTLGTRVGGRPINPKGKIGKLLIDIADYWIKNPNTIWHKGSVWKGFFHDKYPRFYYDNNHKRRC